MRKLKKIFTKWQVLLLIAFLIIGFIAIAYNPIHEGAAIRAVKKDSAAALAGIENPDSAARPMAREVILAVNGVPITSAEDYFEATSKLAINETVVIKTDKTTYNLIVQPNIERVLTNDTQFITEEIFNETTNQTENLSKEVPVYKTNILGPAPLGLSVYDAPTSNIKQGLDLQGGTRVIIEPQEEITSEQFEQIKLNLEQRLNVFGLNDVTVSIVNDFQFNPEYIMIEIAGTTIDEIEELVLSQGKFEAIIGNETVFTGEDRDISYVGKGPQESRIESCAKAQDGLYVCRFSFQIRLTPDAAQRMADITENLDVVSGDSSNSYLSKPIELYLDGENISSLQISSGLKGKAETEIVISGSGAGPDKIEAAEQAKIEMKKLQTVIETGSLPTKLTIVKSDTISPVLGKNFINNAFLVGFIALFVVALILGIRYRTYKFVLPLVIALVSEVFLILSSYAVFGWTLDVASIAGIIIVLGTGVDHLVVITDEIRRNSGDVIESGKVKIQKAFGIIFGAFFTTAFAMLPLLIAGAGLLRGFAVTTLTGLLIGVFLVRPTYAKVIEILMN